MYCLTKDTPQPPLTMGVKAYRFFSGSYRETSGRALRSAKVVCVRGVRFPRDSEIPTEWAW